MSYSLVEILWNSFFFFFGKKEIKTRNLVREFSLLSSIIRYIWFFFFLLHFTKKRKKKKKKAQFVICPLLCFDDLVIFFFFTIPFFGLRISYHSIKFCTDLMFLLLHLGSYRWWFHSGYATSGVFGLESKSTSTNFASAWTLYGEQTHSQFCFPCIVCKPRKKKDRKKFAEKYNIVLRVHLKNRYQYCFLRW